MDILRGQRQWVIPYLVQVAYLALQIGSRKAVAEQEREQGKMAASSRTRERFQFGALIVLCLTGSRGEAMITLTGRGGRDHSLYRV